MTFEEGGKYDDFHHDVWKQIGGCVPRCHIGLLDDCSFVDGGFIDDETKYPVVIAQRCSVGGDSVSFVNEYNLAMMEHFKKSELIPKG